MKTMIYADKELKRMEKPWQMERSKRYGNRRKEIARLKVKDRRKARKQIKRMDRA